MELIHATAVVDPRARVGRDVRIGPYCVVGPEVTLGDGTELKAHVHVEGLTEIGPHCVIFPFASIGTQTQDLKFRGGTPGVRIGANTTLREYVTVNAATFDGDFTLVGSHCHIMAYAHIAHDCRVGDRVIIANAGTLAGHVVIDDQAIIGGLVGIHQFIRIGRLSIIGGCSKVVKDIPPFMMADGHPLKVYTLNKVGLERAGIATETAKHLKQAFHILYRQNLTTENAIAALEAECPPSEEMQQLIAFLRASERGITR